MSLPFKALCSVKVQFEDGVMGFGGKGVGLGDGLCPATQIKLHSYTTYDIALLSDMTSHYHRIIRE